MTVTNIQTSIIGQSISYTWDMTLDYAFILVDGVLSRKPGFQITQDVLPSDLSAYVEIVDNNDANFDPVASQYPQMKVNINWSGSTALDAVFYNIKLDGVIVATIQDDGRTGKYVYSSSRLADSILSSGNLQDHTITVVAVDEVGNQSAESDLNFQSLNAAPQVRGLSVNQITSGAGKIDLDITAPVGW